ncbi:peptide-methionine (R)-S-oxide reductase MsrB [Tenacibaculum sp. A30]|uniref:peptide-methionine (R)-S-oxide reductase MsrB n=1 Tax=Tenacibaculum sp. A30 TaxID=3442644 RepID=UPI003EB9B6F7
MKKTVFLFVLALFVSYSASAQKHKKYKINKPNSEWKKLLTPQQYFVLREAGTERPNSSPLNFNHKKGVYVCAACKTPLYKSENKYDSGSGWPSFDRAILGNVDVDTDYNLGYARTELKCANCGGHLGHSFDDGPKETTGKRHCINGVALEFIPKK